MRVFKLQAAYFDSVAVHGGHTSRARDRAASTLAIGAFISNYDRSWRRAICITLPNILGHHDSDISQSWILLFALAPVPREPLAEEKNFQFVDEHGENHDGQKLPCWRDSFGAQKENAQKEGESLGNDIAIEEPEVYMSLVVPAYNEEERIEIMLTEATEYLQQQYGSTGSSLKANGNTRNRQAVTNGHAKTFSTVASSEPRGWEILVVSDGSTDKTVDTALRFASRLGKDASLVRVITLQENRGKGGAVTHGMRHVRGKYAVFADADGASRFEDLGKLVSASSEIEDSEGRGVAVGSRAHLVGSEAVVKVIPAMGLWFSELTLPTEIFPTELSNAFVSFPAASADTTRNGRD